MNEQYNAKRRNTGFDAIKGCACIAVILMHCEFPGTVGTIIQCITRWSVPLFFSISGYYFRELSVKECWRKIRHIGKIAVIATIFYTCFGILLHLIFGDLLVFVGEEFTAFNLISFLVFNSPVFVNGHLWFLFALIYVYISVAIMLRFNIWKFRKIICIVLLCTHFIISYLLYLLGYGLPAGAYRNWLFEGLPFFLLGNCYYNQEHSRNKVFDGGLMIIAGLVLSLAERSILTRDFSVHIGSIIVLIGGFHLATSNPSIRFPKIMEKLGERYSLYMYILHPAIYLITDAVLGSMFQSTAIISVYLWVRPIWTLVATAVVSVCMYQYKNKRGYKNA